MKKFYNSFEDRFAPTILLFLVCIVLFYIGISVYYYTSVVPKEPEYQPTFSVEESTIVEKRRGCVLILETGDRYLYQSVDVKPEDFLPLSVGDMLGEITYELGEREWKDSLDAQVFELVRTSNADKLVRENITYWVFSTIVSFAIAVLFGNKLFPFEKE